MRVPNDMSVAAQGYFREFVDAGGPEHAAKAYALACEQRDDARKRAAALSKDDELSGSGSQVLLACVKLIADASATAEKLRATLPPSPKPAEPSDDPLGFFAG